MNTDFSQLLPPLSEAEYDALKADIAANGVHYPIIVDELGVVIDGHHRLQICQELGNSPPTEVRAGLSDDQKHELALSLNLQRRHLSTAQRRELIRLELERNPDRSNRKIARLIGVDHKTVAVLRGRGEPERLAESMAAAKENRWDMTNRLAKLGAPAPVWLSVQDLGLEEPARLNPDAVQVYLDLVNYGIGVVELCRAFIQAGGPYALGITPNEWLRRVLPEHTRHGAWRHRWAIDHFTAELRRAVLAA